MLVKIQQSCRYIVAICDSNLIGKRFEEGKLQLDIKESFYKGEEKTKEQVLHIIKKMAAEDATFNIAGKESVQTAIESGLISQENIGKIHGIPFALVLL